MNGELAGMHGELACAGQISSRQMQGRTRARLLAVRPALYIAIILATVVSTWLYTLRHDGVFACQADGYTSDRFLAACSAASFGSFEHGAYWFGLEPAALGSAAHAQVLLLGDSRLQVAFSTDATVDWFKLASAPYYLLGFGFGENVIFAEKLLHKLRPEAKVYIINVDTFFGQWVTSPTKEIFQDPSARDRYEAKRRWQLPHKLICGAAPWLCGSHFALFRSSKTGAYSIGGAFDADGYRLRDKPVSYDRAVDQEKVVSFTQVANDFLSRVPVKRECVILTSIPYPGTTIETSKAIAKALGLTFVAPELDGLQIFDTSHLNHASAQRWSQAFFAGAAHQIQKCLDTRISDARNPG
jgi:hypothetical protein